MSNSNPGAQVLALAKAGNLAEAIRVGEAALLLAGAPDPGLTMFVGVLSCRHGDMPRGIAHLRSALALAPGQPAVATELARALLATGAFEDAMQVAQPLASLGSPLGREMLRICAQALLRGQDPAQAETAFADLTGADPVDFEAWHGLGVARLALERAADALPALQRAAQLQPNAATHWTDLARVHVLLKDGPAAVDAARRAVALAPGDTAAQLELGRALLAADNRDEALPALAAAGQSVGDRPAILCEIADLQFDARAMDDAERSYRAALALRPDLERAWHGLSKLLERLNRTTELMTLVMDAEHAGIAPDATALFRARGLRNEKRYEEALAAARSAPADVDAPERAQLIGDLADRLGDTDTAFAAFSEAKALLAANAEAWHEQANEYRDRYARLDRMLTPEWYGRWPQPAPPVTRRSPLFIFGFPRSGTTLIDTMMSGHPDTVVLEEEPVIDRVAEAMGPMERLPGLGDADIADLRALYFREVARHADVDGRLIVDKNPLGLGATMLLHRLFPDAKFVFAERHPCDVVLSCFITSSQMNAKMASFFDFVSTAELYDHVLSFWTRCCEVLPIDVQQVRYERLIADPETELRGLADFAGLEWHPQLLDHEANAVARSYIGSPSYAQVAQPIYTRARGRWLRYREHMAPVLPILAPWIERMGYQIDDE
ncbi:sulfotransferase [Sphingomonas sp. AOB5]|uniref:tetratricopeptide repeat-containing sulfotransferase family protein n=1 Tax=Sphingomonas sp. AOB5 TaxID=3034017 RepID=UPI0023F6A11A|nr:tetratricopeptide repeat-containing sulfotransferase family protein [Sphingomonas sp. AOB5]MDF7775090.1 sulfotransferase [Sphingomonas sp. AOB5]